MKRGGKTIRVFLADGAPGGLLTAEIMNWTGHVIAAPRSDLAALLAREEVTRTGVYLLLGYDPASPATAMVYIGEGDDISERLKMHHKKKDFWERVVVLTSKDSNLTKAHARYLEARVIAIATAAGRATIDNTQKPDPINLPEADRSDMEAFIDEARIVLPVLGVDLLRSTRATTTPGTTPQGDESPIFHLTTRGTDATAQEIDGEFILRQGSHLVNTWSGAGISYREVRLEMEKDGTLVAAPDGSGRLILTKDTVFKSPSAASAIVLGRSSNGRKEWRVQGTKQTYAEWQESLLNVAATMNGAT